MRTAHGMKLALLLVLAAAAISAGFSGCTEECLVEVDSVPPAVPHGLYPVTGDEQVTLFWWPNTELDLSGYNVYWRREDDRYFKLLATTSETYYVDRGLQNGVTYYYAVTAFDAAGNESALSRETYDTPRPEGFNLKLYNSDLRDRGGSYLLNGYDFDEYIRTDYATDDQTDIYFYHKDGLFLMYATDGTDIQDAGYVPLEDIDWAPEGGWSPTGTAELIMGHSYVVWTGTDNYAKFQVVDMDTDTGEGRYVIVNWAYQTVPGLPELLQPEESPDRRSEG